MLQRIIFAVVVIAIIVAGAVAFYPQLVQPQPSGGTAPAAIPAGATEAIIDYVHDGDTLFLADGRKVRLLAINTPEIGGDAECYGEEAKQALVDLLPQGSHVWVAHDLMIYDQYGRSLLFIYKDDGTNVNLALLEAGAAEVVMYAPNHLLRDEANAAQKVAQDADLGLWSLCRPG